MRSLLQCVALCAVVSLCVGYDSHESTESIEDLFVNPHQANSFIPPRGNFYNFRKPLKTLAERRAETCEDYSPCRYYAYHHGYQQAYQRYFVRAQNTAQNPVGARRH